MNIKKNVIIYRFTIV